MSRGRPIVDLAGRKYAALTVLEYAGRDESGYLLYRCRCDCGREKVIIGASVTSGNTKTCGRHNKQQTGRIRIPGYCNGRPGWTVKLEGRPGWPILL